MISILMWLRIVLYLFTAISLFLAAASYFLPMSRPSNTREWHVALVTSFGILFLLLATAGVLRAVGRSDIGIWIFDYLVTLNMFVTCSLSWRSILLTSRIDFDGGANDVDEKSKESMQLSLKM